MGYADGAGGVVTQLTSKSTAVTLNKPSGAIVMHTANLAAATTVSFVVNNSLIDETQWVPVVAIGGDGTVGAYTVTVSQVNALGSFTISLRNETAGGLAEGVVILFALIRSAVA
jgi:hypothetical protein